MQIKKKIFSYFGPVWETDHAQKIFKVFEFFQLKSKTNINFRNSPKKSKKNTKHCHEGKKLKVARGIGLSHFSCLAGFSICLCIYKCYLACAVVLGSASGTYIQAVFKSILTHIQNLVYPCQIQNPGIIRLTPRYIHNVILSIFTKATSWTFDATLYALLL